MSITDREAQVFLFERHDEFSTGTQSWVIPAMAVLGGRKANVGMRLPAAPKKIDTNSELAGPALQYLLLAGSPRVIKEDQSAVVELAA
jgi:hypothetical protein